MDKLLVQWLELFFDSELFVVLSDCHCLGILLYKSCVALPSRVYFAFPCRVYVALPGCMLRGQVGSMLYFLDLCCMAK